MQSYEGPYPIDNTLQLMNVDSNAQLSGQNSEINSMVNLQLQGIEES